MVADCVRVGVSVRDGLYVFLSGNKGMASGATSLTVSSYITDLVSTVVAFVLVTVA